MVQAYEALLLSVVAAAQETIVSKVVLQTEVAAVTYMEEASVMRRYERGPYRGNEGYQLRPQ